jgi:hypothetical protein
VAGALLLINLIAYGLMIKRARRRG